MLPRPAGGLLFCADALVAGVHADLSLVGLDDFGWKAVAVNVSDIAAMGGRPLWATVTVSGPLGEIDFDLLYDGVLSAAAEYGCAVVGGDLTSAPTLVVSVAMVGDASHPVAGPSPVLRSGAGAGDTFFVTGPLGRSAAGLELLRSGRAGEAPDLVAAHRRPRARLAEGEAARAAGSSAMIDVSDGLGLDLHRLADASGVGVLLEAVPVADGVALAGGHPETMALGGGEDYELLFTAADPDMVRQEFATRGLRNPIRIGTVVADPKERRLRDAPLPDVGWAHR